ncbi:hypothetical protein HKX48_001635 [Thoreauomyces humboldtii]|nr:hypothetical protein HKX48_001635 [Thoreauomyces humboldtii]
MVVISSILGTVIQTLVNKSTVPRDILYCSSLPALNKYNLPIQTVDDPALPTTGTTINGRAVPLTSESQITHVNFIDGTSSLLSSSDLVGQTPCVQNWGLGSPLAAAGTSDPYAMDPQIPAGQEVFGYDSYSSSIDPATLGSRPKSSSFPASDPASVLAFVPNKTAPQANGLLDTIEGRLYIDTGDATGTTTVVDAQPVPWYVPTTEDPNVIMANAIRDVVAQLTTVNKTAITDDNATPQEVANYLTNIANITADLPYGTLYFNTVNHTSKDYDYTMQIGTDARFGAAAGFPSQGIRLILQQTQLNNALLRFSNVVANGASAIIPSTRAMPKLENTKLDLPFASFIGRILFPFGVSFLVPFFVVTLVKEKEDRILGMMRMNGLKVWTYWLAHYVHFYSLHVLSAFVFLVAGRGAKMEMFTRTSAGVLILVLFVWGHAQVALSFLFGSLFSRSQTALVVTFLVILCSVLVSLAGDALFLNGAPSAYFIWPAFAFYRILTLLNQSAFRKNLVPYDISAIRPGNEVFTCIMFLVWEWFVLMGLAVWLSTGGWDRLVERTKGVVQRIRGSGVNGKVTDEEIGPVLPTNHGPEDDDVREERSRVHGLVDSTGFPLVLRDLSKTYPTGKAALKGLSLAAEPGIVFGLLGPNGAGKSTTISILTGLYGPTSGSATVAGFDLVKDRESIWNSIGVCPQHDILWDDLTIMEHLLFYARLKGVSPADETAAVEESMDTVALSGPFRNRLTKGLSGGEKRRLSIAIALVGDPKVVMLDEPTTGLDPEVRRLIWNIVQRARTDRTIVLTTHSMEEAEVLCQRIGIMAHGTLRCVGTPARLKQLYANSFRLAFSVLEERDLVDACDWLETTVLPVGWSKEEAFATSASYAFPRDGGDGADAAGTGARTRTSLREVFEVMENEAKGHGIEQWGVGETTLEEVFVRIIGVGGEDADE